VRVLSSKLPLPVTSLILSTPCFTVNNVTNAFGLTSIFYIDQMNRDT